MHKPLFHRLVGPDIETEEVDPHTAEGQISKAEREAVEGAAQTRIEQFTAGRICSHIALGRLGVASATPILQGEDRAPIWPPGFVGSITHTDSWCAAAVARRRDVRSIGIDLEPATPLKESLWRRVCTQKEREWLGGTADAGLMGKIVFSAKEAVYKCQYPLTQQFLGFRAVEVEIEDGSFRAVFRQAAGNIEPGYVMTGRYLVEDGLVASACELRP